MLSRYPRLERNRGSGRLGAQSSMEFILIFSLLLSILAIGATVSWVRIHGVNEASKNLEVSKVLGEAASKINLAFLEGDGFSINMTIPDRIMGKEYTIDIYKNSVVIYFMNSTYSDFLLTENVTGTISKGTNTLKNKGGKIVIK